MKKSLTLSVVSLFIAMAASYSDIIVVWQGLGGFYRSDDTTGLTEPATGSQTAYAQLIYTPFNSYGSAYSGGDVENFEVVLDSYVITDSLGSDPYGTLGAQNYQGAFLVGYIYARIFDQGTGVDPVNAIGIGSYYYNGPLVATIDNSLPDSPNLYNASQGTSSAFPGADFLNVQVVPEPATLALLGLGGGLLFLSRRRKA